MSKTVRVDPEVYLNLEKLKNGSESFSSVIARLIRTVGAPEIEKFRAIKVSELFAK